jgi:membrane protein implicated in regulation of membrane protease activity
MNDYGIEPQWWWLIVATMLAIAEIIIPGVFLIWLAAGAALTGFLTLLIGPPVTVQFAMFAGLSLAAVYLGRRWYAANPVVSSDPLLNDRATRLIGRNVEVVGPIEGGRGRVRVGDSVWNARGPDCAEGSRVRVTGADGTSLIVDRIAASSGLGQGAEVGLDAGEPRLEQE